MGRDALQSWLLSDRDSSRNAEELTEGLTQRLLAEGVPLWRIRLSVLAMHPEVFSRTIVWRRDKGVEIGFTTFDTLRSNAYIGGPVEAIQRQGSAPIRCRIDVPDDQIAFPQLLELKAQGGTDYLILPLQFTGGRRSFISFATDAKGGFSDAQVERLKELAPFLELRFDLESAQFSTNTLLHVYLGDNAAERVIAGEFQRGTGQLIKAAVWMCDLRGFTSLVDRLPVKDVIPILDAYFECVAKQISSHGGEILKFIGDAVLAVFPVGDDATAACRNSVEAARGALKDFAEHPLMKAHGLRIGVGLTLGEVVYGNIGANQRLDFTVIGPAVNEASRMESMCKALKTPLIFCEDVAKRLSDGAAVSLGDYELRGVSSLRKLFTSPEFAPEPDTAQ